MSNHNTIQKLQNNVIINDPNLKNLESPSGSMDEANKETNDCCYKKSSPYGSCGKNCQNCDLDVCIYSGYFCCEYGVVGFGVVGIDLKFSA